MADAKDAIGTTAKMFWLYQVFALAAALLAFLPDRSSTYTQAIAELRRVLLIHIKADEPDAAIAESAAHAIGNRIFQAVASAAHQDGVGVSTTLKDHADYFLIVEGPQTLQFETTSVGDLLDALKDYASNPAYSIVVPQPAALHTELQKQLDGVTGTITSMTIPCNYAPDRCQGDVYVNPKGDATVGAQRDLQLFVPRVQVKLGFGVRDLVAARYPAIATDWWETPALVRVRDDVAELAPAAAIAKLQELRKGEDRPLSIFDVSLSGRAARVVAPLGLALLAFAAWASASGLRGLGLDAQAARDSLFLPLIATPPAAALRTVAFAFPLLVGEGLLLRAWTTGAVGWSMALVALCIQAGASLALDREYRRVGGAEVVGVMDVRSVVATVLLFGTIATAAGWSIVVNRARGEPKPPSIAARPVKRQLAQRTRQSAEPIPASATAAVLTDAPQDGGQALPPKVRAEEKASEDDIRRLQAMEQGEPDNQN